MCYVCEYCAYSFELQATLLVNYEEYMTEKQNDPKDPAASKEHPDSPSVQELPTETTLTVERELPTTLVHVVQTTPTGTPSDTFTARNLRGLCLMSSRCEMCDDSECHNSMKLIMSSLIVLSCVVLAIAV